jgi:hypothetical protein
MLEKKKQGESVVQQIDGKKIWEVVKQYDIDVLPNDATCVGLGIDVYQESINKTFREYLVNFDYLDKLLKDYGFEKASYGESKGMGGKAVGTFQDCYDMMRHEINREPETEKEYGRAMDMRSAERTVSYLNNYFIYKKVRDVDAKNVMESYVKEKTSEDIAVAEMEKITKPKKNKSRKVLGKKVKLVIMSDEDTKKEETANVEQLVLSDAGDVVKLKVKKTTAKKRPALKVVE